MIEAKPEGATLTGVEWQSAKYLDGLPDWVTSALEGALPFAYPVDRRRDPLHQHARSRGAQPAGLLVPPAGDARRLGPPRAGEPARADAAAPTHAPPRAQRRGALAGPGDRDPQPRALARREPAPRPDPDGDRRRQDVHGGERRLSRGQARRRPPRPVPRRPRQPRPADAEGVPGVHDAGRRTQVHRALQRPAPLLERDRSGRARDDHDDPAALLDPQGRGRARPRARRALRLRPPAGRAGAGRLQPARPDRDVRRRRRRRVPPLDLRRLAAGARLLRRLHRRPDGDAEQAGVRLLQPEPRHGVHARAGRRRPGQRRLRRLPHPHQDHRAGLDDRRRPRHRLPRPADAAAPLGDARRRRRLRRAGARPRGRGQGSDPHGCPRLQGAALHRDLPGPDGGAEDAHLRQGRLARRRHRPDRARGVRQGRRLRGQDHLQVDRPQAGRDDRRVPQLLQPADRRDRRHDRDRHRRPSARVCVLHARREEPDVLRADEGARRARDRRGDVPVGDARREGEEPLRHRRRGRRHRKRPERHATARPQADRPARAAAQAALVRQPRRRRRLDDRRPDRAARATADEGRPGRAGGARRRHAPRANGRAGRARWIRTASGRRPARTSRPSRSSQPPPSSCSMPPSSRWRRTRSCASGSSRCGAPTSRRSTSSRRTR